MDIYLIILLIILTLGMFYFMIRIRKKDMRYMKHDFRPKEEKSVFDHALDTADMKAEKKNPAQK